MFDWAALFLLLQSTPCTKHSLHCSLPSLCYVHLFHDSLKHSIILVQEILLPFEHLKQLTRPCQTHAHQSLKTYFKNVPYRSSFNECNGISDMNYLQKGGNVLITQLWKSSSSDCQWKSLNLVKTSWWDHGPRTETESKWAGKANLASLITTLQQEIFNWSDRKHSMSSLTKNISLITTPSFCFS